jgi:hypothetical protein
LSRPINRYPQSKTASLHIYARFALIGALHPASR